MDTKDVVALVVSAAALIVSLASFYFSQLHKASGAMLILLERTFSPARFQHTAGSHPDLPERQEVSPFMRHLKYSLSNTGKQALYVKNVDLIQGPDPRGHLKSHQSFIIIPSHPVESFLLNPGEIKVVEIDHAMNYDFGEGHNPEKYCYQLVSFEVVSADGNRYQICHNVTNLGASGPDFQNPIWDGTPLGSPVRTAGFV